MANSKAITYEFTIKDSASGTLKKVKIQAKSVDAAIKQMAGQTEKAFKGMSAQARNTVTSMAALTVTLDGIDSAVRGLCGCVAELTAAYRVQVQAETQLATNMRNTMQASDAEIQSIKDLCSAQQELGVIGDEVQLAGAQTLAMFTTQKASLEQLIPVMNDLVAQQYGMNATSENTASIAKMMGKALTGQTATLRRYGLTFTEAQQHILTYGDEAQRVAVLAEIISSKVGGMNAELARTDAGRMKQLENTLGDLKEQAGGALQAIQPYLTLTASISTTTTGFMKMCASIKAVITAIRALGAAVSASVVGLLLTAAAAAAYFAYKHFSATKAVEQLTEAQKRALEVEEAAHRAYGSTQAALTINIGRLKEFNGTRADEKKLVKEMNDTYGSAMGYFKSVAEWYKALTENSAAYCRQLVIQAQLQTLAQQAAQLESERHNLKYDDKGNVKGYDKTRQWETYLIGYTYTGGQYGPTAQYGYREIVGSSEYDKAQKSYTEKAIELNALYQRMDKLAKEATSITMPVIGSGVPPALDTATKTLNTLETLSAELKKAADLSVSIWSLTSVEQYDARIKALHDAQLKANAREYADLQRQIDQAERLKKAFTELYATKSRPDVSSQVTAALGGGALATRDGVKLDTTLSAGAIAPVNRELRKTVDILGELRTGWGSIKSGVSAVGSLTDALNGEGTAWERLSAVIDSVLSLYDSMSAVMSMINTLTQTGTALKGADAAAQVADAAATGQSTTANVANAASGVLASHAKIPFVGIAIAGGMIAAMIALMSSLPKFAQGGIAYGPTLGLFGEYPGAANNPEVVAPLSKLKSYIADAAGSGSPRGRVVFHIKGRELRGVLDNRQKFVSRT